MSVKSMFCPHLQKQVHFGCKTGVKPKPAPVFSHYRTPGVIAIPATFSYGDTLTNVLAQTFLNTQLGCCVIAAMARILGLFTTNNNPPGVILTDAQIIQWYSAIGGYVNGDPSTDNGCDPATAMNYWMNSGTPMGTNKILGWLNVDPTQPQLYKEALYLFEALGAFGNIPDAYTQIAPGFVWNSTQMDPANGHMFPFFGANPSGVEVDSWGMAGTMTDSAVGVVCNPSNGGGLIVPISQDAVNLASQKSPAGIDWPSLVSDFNQIFGGSLVVPSPVTPAPTPAPVPPVVPPVAPPPSIVTWLQAEIQALLTQFSAAMSSHPIIQMLIAELQALLAQYLALPTSQKQVQASSPRTNNKSLLNVAFATALTELEKKHPKETGIIGKMRAMAAVHFKP